MNLKITGLKIDQGGEGSRGGKIIGHTTSGKPIYAGEPVSWAYAAMHPPHEKFTPKDHVEASELHLELKDKFKIQGNERLARNHQLAASSHSFESHLKQQTARREQRESRHGKGKL